MEDFILVGNNERFTIRAANFRIDRQQGQYEFYDTEGSVVASVLSHCFFAVIKAGNLIPNS